MSSCNGRTEFCTIFLHLLPSWAYLSSKSPSFMPCLMLPIHLILGLPFCRRTSHFRLDSQLRLISFMHPQHASLSMWCVPLPGRSCHSVVSQHLSSIGKCSMNSSRLISGRRWFPPNDTTFRHSTPLVDIGGHVRLCVATLLRIASRSRLTHCFVTTAGNNSRSHDFLAETDNGFDCCNFCLVSSDCHNGCWLPLLMHWY